MMYLSFFFWISYLEFCFYVEIIIIVVDKFGQLKTQVKVLKGQTWHTKKKKQIKQNERKKLVWAKRMKKKKKKFSDMTAEAVQIIYIYIYFQYLVLTMSRYIPIKK